MSPKSQHLPLRLRLRLGLQHLCLHDPLCCCCQVSSTWGCCCCCCSHCRCCGRVGDSAAGMSPARLFEPFGEGAEGGGRRWRGGWLGSKVFVPGLQVSACTGWGRLLCRLAVLRAAHGRAYPGLQKEGAWLTAPRCCVQALLVRVFQVSGCCLHSLT